MSIMTSEAVTKGHPDKICDQIADAILDACLREDKSSRVACEVCCTTGTVIIMGEITTSANLDYKKIARDTLQSIGYIDPSYGIDYKSCSVIDLIDKQSPDICSAVDNSLETREFDSVSGRDLETPEDADTQGAGDQGIIFGYACDETNEYMPLSLYLSHKLARRLEYVREHGELTWVRPDGKTLVSVEYDDSTGELIKVDTILISTQHSESVSNVEIEHGIITKVILPVIEECGISDLCNPDTTKFIINPSGRFVIGGPHGDTGLTGRKLAVDTYGGHARFGGGAMCGKDLSKVDRSAAYIARYVAKHLVAANYASKCEVQVSYAIGRANPVSVLINTFGNTALSNEEITDIVKEVFDFRPMSIIKNLNLLDYTYSNISGKCQFGDPDCPWEILDGNILKELTQYKTMKLQNSSL